MIQGTRQEILEELKDLGVEKDIPILMDFNFFGGYSWKLVTIYFRVAIMVYYKSRYDRAEIKELGLTDSAITEMKTLARAALIDPNAEIYPYLVKYIRRFQHLGYREALRKFKRDFAFYIYRSAGYKRPLVCKQYQVSERTIAKYLKESIENDR